MESNFANRINDLRTEMENIQPNFHAADKLKVLMDKVGECSDELDKLKEELQLASTEYEEVKTRRKHLFEVIDTLTLI